MSKHRIGVFPGTFDPVTLGHIDLIERGAKLFDRMIVAVAKGEEKRPLFSLEERVSMIKGCIKSYANVDVQGFDTLLADFMKTVGGQVILRGLRVVGDFDYELQMAQVNAVLAPGVETLYMMASSRYLGLASRHVRDVARFGGDVSLFVPQMVSDALAQQFVTR
jgi:pantetheine-phosphate adenylyltransferase